MAVLEDKLERRVKKMDDKKRLHITMIWIAIAVLSINQGIMAHQNHQAQQLLWNGLIRQTQIATKHL